MGKFESIIINPGAFTHYSYALRDAIAAVNIPTVEVHLSDINNREDFRKVSVIKDVCLDQISGLGKIGYLKGIQRLVN
jgi:3-dehydroquinate dehydratase-2